MVENVITIMNKSLGSAGASSPTEGLLGAANGEGKKVSKAQQETAKGVKNLSKDGMWKKVGKTLGVSLGFSTLLKQSQVFTSTFGIIFQMFGAIADVILAPALPYLMKAILPLFKIGMNVGKSLGIIVKTGIEVFIKWIKFIDWFYTKVIPFYPEVKGFFKKFGDGTIVTEFLQKVSTWYLKEIDKVIPRIQEFIGKWVDWFVSKLPKWLGGKGSDAAMPKLMLATAKHASKYVFPKILPDIGSDEQKQVVRASLGITAEDIASVAGAVSEVESQRQIAKYGFSFGATGPAGDAILDSIKMDAEMIADMKMNSTGYGSGGMTH